MTERLEPTQARDGRQATVMRFWYGLLAIVAAVILGMSLLSITAASPRTCETCHADVAVSLKASPHKQATCADCHQDSTTTGIFADRLGLVDMAVAQVLGQKTIAGTPVDETRCLKCHDKQALSATNTRNGIRMNHRATLEKGVPCVSCHPFVGHGQVSNDRLGYSMDSCLSCHSSNPKDLNSCTLCHSDPNGSTRTTMTTPWRVTHGPGWQSTHGMGDLKTCRSCHQDNFCLKCHNVTMPHDDGYVGTHGAVVKSLPVAQRKGCYTCHKQNSCDNCHGLQMPHPVDFLKTHDKLAKADKAKCMKCHGQDSCDSCHVAHTHPGLSEPVKKALLANPVNTR